MSEQVIFDRKNVLVVGGAGFIGSHLCDELVKENKVICVDNFSTGSERNIDHLLADPNFIFIRQDISKPLKLKESRDLQRFKVQFQGVQEVYNLACPTSPRNFKKNRIANLMANSVGLKNILDLVVENEAKFMHFSSGVVYGGRNPEKGNEKVKEEDIKKMDFLSERGSYDEGKRFAETMVKNYRDVYELDAKIIRPFRIYGPRMKLNDDRMLPDFINNALDNKDLVILGDDSFASSFCYISDLIDATMKMMESEVKGPLNIGSDVDVPIKQLAEKVIELTGSESSITYGEENIFMTPLRIPDIGKANEQLGWMPVVTLNKGLENTIDDLRATKGLKNLEY